MANVLGISIGTRNVGLAVIKLRKLRDHRIRTFPGKWTSSKCEHITDTVEAIIKRNKITDIALKIPNPSHCSENLEELIEGIRELAGWFNAEVHTCTIQDIKLPYAVDGKGNKQVMVAALVDKYPQLIENLRVGKRSQAYNARLFEAIACAELALRAGH
jgi:hypothetical protein